MKTVSIFINSLKMFLVNIKIYFFVFLIVPLIFSFMYGTIYKDMLSSNVTIEKFKVAYVNLDNSDESKPLEKVFKVNKLNKIISLEKLSNTKNLNNALIHGDYAAAVVIPKNFSQNIQINKKSSIEVLKAPSAGTKGEIISDIVNSYCSYLNMNSSVYRVLLKNSKDEVLTEKIFASMLPVIERDLSNNHLTYKSLPKAKLIDIKQQFSVNMLIMFSLFIALTEVISVLKEKESGTLSRIYSTATSKLCFYFGKLLAVFTISVVQIVCFLAISTLLIKINFGSCFTMIPIILIHAVVVSAITGVLIILFSNINLVSIIFSFAVVTMSLLSGSFYPSDYSAGFVRNASHFTINYWLKNLYFSNMFNDGISSIAEPITIILVISLLFISLGAVKLKYEY